MSKLYYRFELCYCDDPQGVGILNGLADVGLAARTHQKLMKPFDALTVPDMKGTGQYLFWFTEQGVHTFAPHINAIIKALKKTDWTVIAGVEEHEDGTFAYEDENQVAWLKPEDFNLDAFEEVNRVEDLYKKESI